jgi:imidazolonepropionase-like amidohydrolase
VPIAVGTDTVHQDLAAELRALGKAGYEPGEAVQAVTGWGAEALQLPAIGTVAPGNHADLVAIDGNPLVDLGAIGRVRGVIRQGELVAPWPLPGRGFGH